MTKTDIAWTDRTWNPIRGCTVISPGCALGELAIGTAPGIVTAYKLPRAPLFVVPRERTATPTCAGDDRVWFSRLAAAIREPWSVLHRMVSARCDNINVLRPVVGLDAVDVVWDFAWTQEATELVFSDEPVFVDVAAHISEMVSRLLYEHVPVGCDGPTTFPVVVSRPEFRAPHNVRVTRIVGANVS